MARKGRFSCRGILDFDEDCKLGKTDAFTNQATTAGRLLMFIECQLFSLDLVNYIYKTSKVCHSLQLSGL